MEDGVRDNMKEGGNKMSKRMRLFKRMIILSVILVLGVFGLYSVLAGELEPTAAPGSTMYTLEEMYNYRVWRMLDKTFVDHPGNTRFAVDGSGELVLDKDTGLIWARDANLDNGGEGNQLGWVESTDFCRELDLGDRMGWRRPSVEELSSLLDPSAEPNEGDAYLPDGHPFVNVQDDDYWAEAASGGAEMSYSYIVNMGSCEIGTDDAGSYYVWPVWGGSGLGF